MGQSNSKQGKVSVIMGLYLHDDAQFLPNAIKSILNQSFRNLEFIIVMDATTPQELEDIVNRFSEVDDRVIPIKINRRCIFPEVLNIAISSCSGDYIARMDPDDVSLVDRLAEQVSFLEANPDVDIVGSFAQEIDSQGNEIFSKVLPKENGELRYFQSFRDAFVHPSVMFKSDFFSRYGLYSESFDHKPFEDTELWCRSFLKGAVGANIPKELIHFRQDQSFFSRRGNLSYAIKEYLIRSAYRKSIGLPKRTIALQLAVAAMRIAPRTVKQFLYRFAR